MSDRSEKVGRVRKGRGEVPFTVVRNDLINHSQLSVEARLLMIYLLSRPDDWDLRISDVRRFLGRDGKPCGRDKTYCIVRELKQANYLVMCEDVVGQHFAGVTYYVFDEPVTDPSEVQRRHRAGENALDPEAKSPLTENQEAERFPLPDFPDTENTEGTNKRYIQNTDPPTPPKQRKRTRRNGLGRDVLVDAAALTTIAEPWSAEWVEHRIRLLRRGREEQPTRPPKFIAALIAKGGEAGERERLAHIGRTCWPTIRKMDEATQDGRGWRVPLEIFHQDLGRRYRSVRVDSPEFERWQMAHRQRGWPEFPVPSRAQCVLLPIEGVAALDVPNDGPTMAAAG